MMRGSTSARRQQSRSAEPSRFAAVAPIAFPDWREADDYAWLEALPREAFAWEWLRRQPAYRSAAMAASRAPPRACVRADLARRWNLHAFEDPDLTAIEARPMWTREAYPSVLCAHAMVAATPSPETVAIARFPDAATVIRCGRVQHLNLSNGVRSLRLDLWGERVGKEPLRLRYDLHGVRSLGPPLETLRRFKFFIEHGRFSIGLHPPEPRSSRMILVLRVFDALNSGATQRDLAGLLGLRALSGPGWRSDHPSLRSRAQRLVGTARGFGAGGFWQLLR